MPQISQISENWFACLYDEECVRAERTDTGYTYYEEPAGMFGTYEYVGDDIEAGLKEAIENWKDRR